MKKIFFILLLLIFTFLSSPMFVKAQENSINSTVSDEEIFKAIVTKVLEDTVINRENGSASVQQKLILLGLDGNFKDQEILFDGTKYDVLSASRYKLGDKVLINYSKDINGNENFYVIDYVRTNTLLLLTILFILSIIIVAKLKGIRALIVLTLTVSIILKFVVPQIMKGANPLLISILGCVFILILAIYITEGFSRESSIAIVSIIFSLFFTGALSILFTNLSNLTGFASEEAMFLVGAAGTNINIKGLLLAGIIIGTLGVLDDIVISQISVAQELKKTNPGLTKKEVYKKTMKIGVSHMSSMTNTLFLAYAGASLPLLILFNIHQQPVLSFSQIINNEAIATEVLRTLVGSIGIVISIPLSTFLAAYYLKNEK